MKKYLINFSVRMLVATAFIYGTIVIESMWLSIFVYTCGFALIDYYAYLKNKN